MTARRAAGRSLLAIVLIFFGQRHQRREIQPGEIGLTLLMSRRLLRPRFFRDCAAQFPNA